MSIASRPDVPEDVKQLVSMVRKDLTNVKRVTKRLQSRIEKADEEKQAKLRAAARTALAGPPKPAAVPAAASTTAVPAAASTTAAAPVGTTAAAATAGSTYAYKTAVKPVVSWDERMKELEHFYKGNGHCRVPIKTALGKWVSEVRAHYRILQNLAESDRNEQLNLKPVRPYHLTHERVAKLKEMNFDWGRPAPEIVPFDVRFQQLKEWKQKNGHLMVPRGCNEPKGLGEFVHNQRRHYKLKNKRFMEEKFEKLNAIGFEWESHIYKPSFEERLEECRKFRRAHGHLQIPAPPKKRSKKKDDSENGSDDEENDGISNRERNFRCWAERVRLNYKYYQDGKKSSLDRTRVRKLDEMGFGWTITDEERKERGHIRQRGKDGNEEYYNAQLAKLRHVKVTYGDIADLSNVKAAFPDDPELLKWMKNQRHSYQKKCAGRKHHLTDERQLALESLGFNFKPSYTRGPNRPKEGRILLPPPLSPPSPL